MLYDDIHSCCIQIHTELEANIFKSLAISSFKVILRRVWFLLTSVTQSSVYRSHWIVVIASKSSVVLNSGVFILENLTA